MKKTLLVVMVLFNLVVYGQQSFVRTETKSALFASGYEYLNGISRPLNKKKALELFKQGAAEGDPLCMNALGNMYANGVEVAADIATSISWYKKAGKAGNSSAYYNLGQLYQAGDLVPQNFGTAADYYKQGAALNDNECKSWLAYMHYKGLGVRQDYARAVELYTELANNGNGNAMYFLGLCYRSGYGVTANQEIAKQWLKKAVDHNETQAIHELTAEPEPENRSVISDDLQNKMSALKNYTEKFAASPANNIGGTYTGYAVYFDFSGKFVHEIVPLTVTLNQTKDGYSGTWTEGEDLKASIKGSFSNNEFAFDNSSTYVRHNYYSYRGPENYQFNKASLNIKYYNDEMFLSGDVQFYSISRKEPGHPMFISLSRKAGSAAGGPVAGDVKIDVSPNPVSNTVKAVFTLKQPSKVILRIMSLSGKPLQTSDAKTLPAGTYTYPFTVTSLAAGSYVMQVITDTKTESKIFIKQ